MFRPFPTDAFLAALPTTVTSVAVLDRTKEPGSVGEPLLQDVVTALADGGRGAIRVVGGRYGLGSKEFTPAMAKAVFDEAGAPDPKRRFTVGIVDDVTHTSLDVDESFTVGHDQTTTVKHDQTNTIENDKTTTVNGTHTETIKKDTKIYVTEGPFLHDVQANTATYHVKGAVTETFDDVQETTVDKHIQVKSNTQHIHLTAKTEIKLTVGKSEILMKEDGTIDALNKKWFLDFKIGG